MIAVTDSPATPLDGMRTALRNEHLPAAFPIAELRQVLAALWTVNNKRSTQVTDNVSSNLTASGSPGQADAAFALHRAFVRLGAEQPHAPLVWAPYVHSGP